MTYLC